MAGYGLLFIGGGEPNTAEFSLRTRLYSLQLNILLRSCLLGHPSVTFFFFFGIGSGNYVFIKVLYCTCGYDSTVFLFTYTGLIIGNSGTFYWLTGRPATRPPAMKFIGIVAPILSGVAKRPTTAIQLLAAQRIHAQTFYPSI